MHTLKSPKLLNAFSILPPSAQGHSSRELPHGVFSTFLIVWSHPNHLLQNRTISLSALLSPELESLVAVPRVFLFLGLFPHFAGIYT